MRIPLLAKIMAVLIAVPLLDMGAILLMSHYTGAWVTFFTVVACGVLGAFLVRREGIAAWANIKREIALGEIPERSLLDSVLILAAGILLMTPGPLTDLLGLLLLTPPVRAGLRQIIYPRIGRAIEGLLTPTEPRAMRQAVVTPAGRGR